MKTTLDIDAELLAEAHPCHRRSQQDGRRASRPGSARQRGGAQAAQFVAREDPGADRTIAQALDSGFLPVILVDLRLGADAGGEHLGIATR